MNMADRKINTKAALVGDIIPAWTALNQTLEGLTDWQKRAKDANGWSVKDHLVHLAAWENSVVYMLQGKPRHEGLGVEAYTYALGDEDVINAAIQKKNRNLSYRQAYEHLQEVHATLMWLVEGMSNAALLKPYRAYLPDEPSQGEGPPVINLIYGNTAYHFNEHLVWINDLIAGQ
jgi:hypothetical protein